jgi:hypothetical protein
MRDIARTKATVRTTVCAEFWRLCDSNEEAGRYMKNAIAKVKGGLVLVLIGLVVGCVLEPAEGRYDADHHRYYHDHGWHDCGDHDEHCHR